MLVRAAVLTCLFLVGCGGSDSASAPSSSALTGMIAGKSFKADGGVATIGMTPSDRFIVVRSTKPDCADLSGTKNGEQVVTFEVAWKAGATQTIDAKHTVTLEKVPDSVYATMGEIEVVSAPTGVNAVGVLKLLATDDADNTVDGEVDITVCQ